VGEKFKRQIFYGFLGEIFSKISRKVFLENIKIKIAIWIKISQNDVKNLKNFSIKTRFIQKFDAAIFALVLK
jgi:hypothetical protein